MNDDTDVGDLDALISHYYAMMQTKRYVDANKIAQSIRSYILVNGCPEQDIISAANHGFHAAAPSATTVSADPSSNGKATNHNNQASIALGRLLTKIGGSLPIMRRNDDTLRGKVWRLTLGVGDLDASDYRVQVSKEEASPYSKIRGDTKRTFFTSEEYNSRVSEERLVRVLNSFVQKYELPYCQGMDAIAAGLLYVMPELNAFATFSALMKVHFPTYFYSDKSGKKDLIGAFAGSYLAWDVVKICDHEIYNHLKALPAFHPYTYLFPLVASFQAISQPFTQLQRLWDFLYCFGVHLNPVLAAAQIIVKKKILLNQNVRFLQGILAQRNWMNKQLDARECIDCAMGLIQILRKPKHSKLWLDISEHASKFGAAIRIKTEYDTGVSLKEVATEKNLIQKEANFKANTTSTENDDQ